jgi:tetratricopeptide (TPR) repeat protein
MAIEVHCDCGNVYTVGVELSGKKLRCKTCNVVLKVPLVPVGESSESAPPSSEFEVVKDEGVACATCGAPGKAGDSVCLACGAVLQGGGAPALVPRTALIAGIAVVVLVVVAIVVTTVWRSMHLSGLIAKGHDRLEKRDFGAARTAFEEALKASKDNLDALDGLVQIGIEQPSWNLVKNYGEKLAPKLPAGSHRARTLASVARAHLETGDFKQAERFAQEALKEDPSQSGMDEVSALALFGSSPGPEAAEALKKADASGSRDPKITLALAKLAEPTNVHEARGWVDKAAGIADSDASVWVECARLREKDGDREGALGALKKAVQLDPQSAQAQTHLALAYLDAKDSKALETAKVAKSLAPDDALAARTLGAALLESNDAAGAKAELERAERLAPDDPAPSFLLGKALVRNGDVPGGIERLERALHKSERDAALWLEAGRIVLVEGKQPEKASAFLEHCLALKSGVPTPTPEQRGVFASAGVFLARALAQGEGAREQRARRIEEALRDSITLDPKRRDAYLELGTHLLDLNNAKAAQEALERGLAVFPDDEDLLYKAGDAGIKVNSKDALTAAVEHLQRLVNRRSDYPHAKDRLDVAKRALLDQ